MTSEDSATPVVDSPRRIRAEILIVLGLSLGYSAIWSALRLIERYLQPTPVGGQATTINPSRSRVEVMDMVFQATQLIFQLVPVALVFFLLSARGANALKRVGLVGGTRSIPGDLGKGALLAALIGIPGIGLYVFGRAIGQSVKINTSGLPDAWWSITMLMLSAVVAAILEETIVVGYLVSRLQDLKWGVVAIVLTSALIRGSYHLYQGWPMAVGNVAMGVVFALFYLKYRRLGPLIAAHFLLDFVAFVGPEVIPNDWLDAIGVTK